MPGRDIELTYAEQSVQRAAQSGQVCDFNRVGLGPDNEGNRGTGVMRASVLHDLCVGAVHPKGVRVRGARIVGMLDFEWETLDAPLLLDGCLLEDPVTMCDALVKSVALTNCSLVAVTADRMQSTGQLSLAGSAVSGGVTVNSATLGADLVLDGATIKGSPYALSARLITVAGDISCRDLRADGELLLLQSSVRGDLVLRYASISSGRLAVNAGRASVGGFVTLDSAMLSGGVRLTQCQIGAGLRISRTRVVSAELRPSLRANAISTSGAIVIEETQIEGTVKLARAEAAALVIRGAMLQSASGSPALDATGMSISGNAEIDRTVFNNDIDLTAAHVAGLLTIRASDHRETASSTARIELNRADATEILMIGTSMKDARQNLLRNAPANKAWPNKIALSNLTDAHVAIAYKMLVASVIGVALTLVVILAVLLGQHRNPSSWLFAIVGIAALGLTILGLAVVGSNSRQARYAYAMMRDHRDAATDPRMARAAMTGTLWSRIRPQQRALQATLASQAAIDRIGQSLAARLIAGSLRNYSGILSVALNSADANVAPREDGTFTLAPGAPLSMTFSFSDAPVAQAFTQSILIADGMDAPVVDFDLIVTVEDEDATPHFSGRGEVSISPVNPTREVGMATTAPSAAGNYLLVVELLQQNRLVHVLRAPIEVTGQVTNG